MLNNTNENKIALDAHLVESIHALLSVHGNPTESIKKYKDSIYLITASMATSDEPYCKDDLNNLTQFYVFLQRLEKIPIQSEFEALEEGGIA